jgi:hypothetical protein
MKRLTSAFRIANARRGFKEGRSALTRAQIVLPAQPAWRRGSSDAQDFNQRFRRA